MADITTQGKPVAQPVAKAPVRPAPTQAPVVVPSTPADRLVLTPAYTLPSVPSYGQLPTFKSFDEYKRFADAIPFARLPEYQKVHAEVAGVHALSQKALAEKKVQVGYGPVEAEQKGALAQLDQAKHPGRERAHQLLQQTHGLNAQIGELSREIGELTSAVSRAQIAKSRSGPVEQGPWWVGVLSVGADLADSASISSMHKNIAAKNGQIVQLQIQMSGLQIQAAAAESMPPDPAVLALAQDRASKAQTALQQLDTLIAPEANAAASVGRVDLQAKTNVDNLMALKAGMQDYKSRFGKVTRLSNPSIKGQVEAYWTNK